GKRCASRGQEPATRPARLIRPLPHGDPPFPGRSPLRTSGIQQPGAPDTILQAIDAALVQPERHAVPELESFRRDTVAGPMRRPRHRTTGKLLLELRV